MQWFNLGSTRQTNKVNFDDIRFLLKQKQGNKILNPNPDFFSYTVSKFGLEGATKLLAMRFAPKIRVFGIAPGITLQSGDQTIQNFKKVHNNTPLNSGATPEEIAATCVFLEKIQSMTGFTIPIDGGHSMYNYGKDIQYT